MKKSKIGELKQELYTWLKTYFNRSAKSGKDLIKDLDRETLESIPVGKMGKAINSFFRVIETKNKYTEKFNEDDHADRNRFLQLNKEYHTDEDDESKVE